MPFQKTSNLSIVPDETKMNNQNFHSLTHPILERAERYPDHPAIILVGSDTTENINVAQFNRNSLQFAGALHNLGITANDLVILVMRHSATLLAAFWGTLYMGGIPSIFPFLTEKLDPVLYMQRVRELVENSNARIVITSPEFYDAMQSLLDGVDCLVIDADQVKESAVSNRDEWHPAKIHDDKTAFLQHSSGTTGLQKGVALSHRAVLNQIRAYSKAIQLNAEDVIVSWLPLYHDMGLIAGFVMPIVTGTPVVLISPFEWVRKPQMLLQAIHEHRGTLSWLPNFAFNHMARTVRPRHMEGLDLRSWRAAINCSEPVQHNSHNVFLQKFKDFGFQDKSLSVCYAMAENTFAVTQTPIGEPPLVDTIQMQALHKQQQAIPANESDKGSIRVVSCGYPLENTEIKIVRGGEQLGVRCVGEILLKGSSMLSSYHNREDLTDGAIQDGWFRTGDMGYLTDGQLYLTGRKKDLIIVGGKNIYPQDLEEIANHIEGICPGRVVAFGVFDDRLGSEAIIMVCELQEKASAERQLEIEHALRKRITSITEISLADVRLVEKRWLIKTSSGKIARADNREKYYAEFGRYA
jgi:fatty-acyl-CoA synthase